MGQFFIDYEDGRIATRQQLADAGLVDAATDRPPRPWHPIGPGDASTMWYAVMRKRTRGIYLGAMCMRYTQQQASLEAEGWEEVPVKEIGVGGPAAAS